MGLTTIVLTLIVCPPLLVGNARAGDKGSPATPPVDEKIAALERKLQQQDGQLATQKDQIERLEQQLQENSALLRRQLEQVERLQSAKAPTPSGVTAKAGATEPAPAVQDTLKAVKDLEHPTAIHYKSVNITPGGYLDATFIGRSRNMNSDVISNFNYFPFDGVANSSLTEFRMTARQSRLCILAEALAGKTKLSGYYELDFLGTGPTANQIETNSFNPRQRQLWGQAEFQSGLTVTAGQMWSLLTTHRKGIANRAEFIPTTIEGSYVIGWDYVRQTSVRMVRNFNNRTWLAFELANPETTLAASYVPPNLFGFNNSPTAISPTGATIPYLPGSCSASAGFQCNPAPSAFSNGLSTNLAPDLIAKAAFEPGWGHYEVKAIGRFFRDRIDSHNNVAYGGGMGAAAVLPVKAKKIDFILEGLAGTGIGRYGASASPDVTLRPDGWIIPLRAVHVMGGLEFHPHPKFDFYVYGGDEYIRRAAYVDPTNAAKPAGYGSALVNNTSCGVEALPSSVNGVTVPACGAQNKNLYDATTGFYYRLYKGPFGTLQYGAQIEFLHRTAWSGVGGAPQGSAAVGMASIRYVLP